ncbi:MAG: DivIVA domain-containing protein [candidate division WOR-3 bacterium]
MDITPLEIKKQEFKKSLKGYDIHEVTTFLNTVSEQFEELLKENYNLKEQIENLSKELERYKNLEKTLQETLTSATKSSSELRANALKEAEIIKKNAQLEAEAYLASSRAELNNLKNEIKSLITLKNNFLSRFRGILESYFKTLDQEVVEHKIEVNEINKVLREHPEKIVNFGSLFSQIKKEGENDGEDKKDI